MDFLFQEKNYDTCGIAVIFMALLFNDPRIRNAIWAKCSLPEHVKWLSELDHYQKYARAVKIVWFMKRSVSVADLRLSKACLLHY